MNYVLKALLITTVFTSCGKDEGSGGQQAAEVGKPNVTGTNQPSAPTDAPYTLSLDNASQLPKCTDANKAQLIYLRTEKEFRSCSGLIWEYVSIQGEKGAKGDKGDTGTNGATGSTGATGAAGKDGQTVNGNMWYDPASGKYYFVGGRYSNYLAWSTVCSGNWRVPTQAEISDAFRRGMGHMMNQIGAHLTVWYGQYQFMSMADESLTTATGAATYLCIQK